MDGSPDPPTSLHLLQKPPNVRFSSAATFHLPTVCQVFGRGGGKDSPCLIVRPALRSPQQTPVRQALITQ